MKIEELNLSVRSYHCLKRAGIHTVEPILSMSKADLLRIHGMGINSATEVIAAVKKLRMTEGDKIRGMTNKELAEFIRDDQCNAVLLQRVVFQTQRRYLLVHVLQRKTKQSITKAS